MTEQRIDDTRNLETYRRFVLNLIAPSVSPELYSIVENYLYAENRHYANRNLIIVHHKGNVYYTDLEWISSSNNPYTPSYIKVLPLGEELKTISLSKENGIMLEPGDCVFFLIRGKLEQTEFGWVDSHWSYEGGYCVIWEPKTKGEKL